MKRLFLIAAGCLAALGVVVVGAAVLQLASLERLGDFDVRASPRQATRLYSRPLVLHTGARIGADSLRAHLRATAHRRVASPGVDPGEYTVDGATWRIGARAFSHPAGSDPGGTFQVRLAKDGRIAELRGAEGRRTRELWLEPAVLATFDPGNGRDQRRVPLASVPDHLRDAVIAIEDQRFGDHRGLDLRRIAGALLANLRAGRIVQGGSTLTQQLVKNLYLSRERTWFRKLQEAPLAVLLELRRSKEEILEAYLNEIYLGQRGDVAIHGVGRAAEHWFGRPVERLALHESALLAGMLRGPSLYSPRRDPKLARARRDLVLTEMHETGSIDATTLAAARAQPLGIVAPRRLPRSTRYFVDFLRPEVTAATERLGRDGLRVFTTLDLRLQRIAERVVRDGVERLEQGTKGLASEGARLQVALVALDPNSGHVLAMVGGRDYGASQFNRATEARRQPGSVFKTVAALAALTPDRGEPPPFTLATLVEDAPISMETPEGDWEPRNHDGEFRGLVTLREIVEHSLNVPMVRVGQEIGPRRVVRAARRLGIESRLHGVPSLVLGTSEVTLLEMTRAYGVLAAEGWRAEPRSVIGIDDGAGAVLERHPPDGVRAFDAAEAHLVTSALQGVVNRGTGAGVRARGFTGPLAGKTGTTDEYRDAWFIGYVPELTVGVWVGFDDGRTLRNPGSRAALPIFADFLIGALGPSGSKRFRVPAGIERVAVRAAEGHRAGLRCGGEPEVFLLGTGPERRCDPWTWFADRREAWWGDDLPPVAAPPQDERSARPRRGLRFRLPSWLDPIFGRPEPRGEPVGTAR